MNLYLRLLWVILRARSRERLAPGNLRNEITTLVLPNDLDLNLHVNNGRYQTFCDFNRVDLFVRTGLARLMVRNRWAPIVAEHTMTYIKPLAAFDRVRVTMEITHWDEKFFYATHALFRRDVKVAEGTSKSLVIGRGQGRLAPADVVQRVRDYQSA